MGRVAGAENCRQIVINSRKIHLTPYMTSCYNESERRDRGDVPCQNGISCTHGTGGRDLSSTGGLHSFVMDLLPRSICKARAGLMPALAFLRRTVGGRGVCVVQARTDAWSAHKTAHIGTTRPTPRSKRLRRCAFPTCAAVQPLVLRLQAALGSGFSLQAAFWYQNAMLALFLRSKKSLKRSLRLLPPFRTPHKI